MARDSSSSDPPPIDEKKHGIPEQKEVEHEWFSYWVYENYPVENRRSPPRDFGDEDLFFMSEIIRKKELPDLESVNVKFYLTYTNIIDTRSILKKLDNLILQKEEGHFVRLHVSGEANTLPYGRRVHKIEFEEQEIAKKNKVEAFKTYIENLIQKHNSRIKLLDAFVDMKKEIMMSASQIEFWMQDENAARLITYYMLKSTLETDEDIAKIEKAENMKCAFNFMKTQETVLEEQKDQIARLQLILRNLSLTKISSLKQLSMQALVEDPASFLKEVLLKHKRECHAVAAEKRQKCT
jgi:hypothetical protein